MLGPADLAIALAEQARRQAAGEPAELAALLMRYRVLTAVQVVALLDLRGKALVRCGTSRARESACAA